jgi:hypothetical protein
MATILLLDDAVLMLLYPPLLVRVKLNLRDSTYLFTPPVKPMNVTGPFPISL